MDLHFALDWPAAPQSLDFVRLSARATWPPASQLRFGARCYPLVVVSGFDVEAGAEKCDLCN